jgi:hypothetical protein
MISSFASARAGSGKSHAHGGTKGMVPRRLLDS